MNKAKKQQPVAVGVIGGSGVYEIEGIEDLREVKVRTPFGDPSDSIMTGTLSGVRCAFLPRHGRGHRIMPSEVNYRANIWAMKSLGVRQLLSISACGSLKEEIQPRQFVIPDQLFDRTRGLRQSTFFGNGIVAHVGFADPFCKDMSADLYDSCRALNIPCHHGGTYVCMEGPMFSTRAESHVYRNLGCSIIGMTAIPEAKLAREAEICYATVGLVTDYDVWKEGEEVSVEAIINTIKTNVLNVKKLIKAVIPNLAAADHACACGNALEFAVMTVKDKKSAPAFRRLSLLLGKYK